MRYIIPEQGQAAGNGTAADDYAVTLAAAKAWAKEKLAQMTLEEKILVLTGEDMWRTPPVRRLGISRLKTSDGPVGVRGGIFTDGVTAAALPTGYVNQPQAHLYSIKQTC